MSSAEINNMIVKKFKEITSIDNEFKMIIDLLEHERHYNKNTDPNTIKREFQLLLEQYFPMGEDNA